MPTQLEASMLAEALQDPEFFLTFIPMMLVATILCITIGFFWVRFLRKVTSRDGQVRWNKVFGRAHFSGFWKRAKPNVLSQTLETLQDEIEFKEREIKDVSMKYEDLEASQEELTSQNLIFHETIQSLNDVLHAKSRELESEKDENAKLRDHIQKLEEQLEQIVVEMGRIYRNAPTPENKNKKVG